MSLCQLVPIGDGRGYCPACDPHARRPIPLTARRRCYGIPSDPAMWQKPVDDGVGTRLKRLFSSLGIRESSTCRCSEYARKLDTLGPRWCRENIGEIVEHLVGEANKRRWLRLIPFKRLIARVLVLRVINDVERSTLNLKAVTPIQQVSVPMIRKSPMARIDVPDFKADKQNILHITIRKGWQDLIRRAQFALGDGFQVHEVTTDQKENIGRIIAHAPAGTIVCNHAFAVDTERFLDVARTHGDKAFIAINHCSLNHAIRWPHYFTAERQSLEATRELSNLWYACPDPNSDWKRFGYEKTFWWPNPVYVPDDTEPRPVNPPCVAIVGRDDWMKGFASQIMAMAMMKQQRPELRLVAVINHAPPNWYGLELAKACGIELEMVPWKSPDEWYRFLRDEVSLVLQCSMAESFNYVSVDALIHGRPFVGSCSIRHTPPEWFADHAVPLEIARVALQILDDYEEQSIKARKIADEIVHRQNNSFVDIINMIGALV